MTQAEAGCDLATMDKEIKYARDPQVSRMMIMRALFSWIFSFSFIISTSFVSSYSNTLKLDL